ncbi:MAG: hypothetical protein WC624_01285 [Candidatus Margulisiibacteriota bacterium]
MGQPNTVNRVSGSAGAASSANESLYKLARQLMEKLLPYGLQLFVVNGSGEIDNTATTEKIKAFFKAEGIEESEDSVTSYLKWVDDNKATLDNIKTIEKETGLKIFAVKDGVKTYKASIDNLKAQLAQIFSIEPDKVNLKDHSEKFILTLKRLQEGITAFAFAVPTGENKPVDAAQNEALFERARKLSPLGINLFVIDGEGAINEKATLAKIQYFNESLGISNIDNFNAFVDFLTKMKKGTPEERQAALKTLIGDKKPEYIAKALDKAKEITDLKSLGERIINRNYKLLVVRGEDKTLQYYWLAPTGKVEKVSETDERIIKSSIIPTLLAGGFAQGPQTDEPDQLSVYRSIKGADVKTILIHQALISGIKPQTLRALQAMINEGKTLKEVVDNIKELNEKVEKAAKTAKTAEGSALAANSRIQAAGKKTGKSFERKDTKEGVRNYWQTQGEMDRAQPVFNYYRAAVSAAIQTQKKAEKDFEEICKKLGIDKKEIGTVLNALEFFQNIYLNSEETDLDAVADGVESARKLIGTSLKEAGSLIAVFDRKIFNNLMPASEKPASAAFAPIGVGQGTPGTIASVQPDSLRVVSKEKQAELAEHPIILIKSALAGVVNSSYAVDLSSEVITSRDLLNVADLFSPRYKIESLGYNSSEEQAKILSEIQKAINSASNDKEKEVLKKLFESVKSDSKTFFARNELKILKSILEFYKMTEISQAKKPWTGLYNKIFNEDGSSTYRVKCTRGGLSERDYDTLVKYANSQYCFIIESLLADKSDGPELREVKNILRTISRQLSDVLKKGKVDSLSSAVDYLAREIKSASKATQELDLPQDVEEHLWLTFRWEQISANADQKKEYMDAVRNLEKAKKDLFEVKKKAEAKSREMEDKKKKGESISDTEQKELEVLQKDFEAKRTAFRAAAEIVQKLTSTLRLDGIVTLDDVKAMLDDKSLAAIMPMLDAIMLDHNGLRLNSVFEIKKIDDLRTFIIAQIQGNPWSSLVRDPGENIRTSIAKKIVSIILSQKYFNKVRQGNLPLAAFSLLPFANTAKTLAILGLGAAGYEIDRLDDGREPSKAVAGPMWLYNHLDIPGVKQLFNLTQGLGSEPNTNIAPYIHLLLMRIGSRDSFHINEKLFGNGLGKATGEEIKTLVVDLAARIRDLNPVILAEIEKKLPSNLKKIWDSLRNNKELWDKEFAKELNGDGPFELFTSSGIGKKMLEVIQLAFFVLQTGGELIAPYMSDISGGHIGQEDINRTLQKGNLEFNPSKTKQSGVVNAGDAGYMPVKTAWTGIPWIDSALRTGKGSLDTILEFTLMQATFFEMGAQKMKEALKALEAGLSKGDWTQAEEALKQIFSLWIGVGEFEMAAIASPLLAFTGQGNPFFSSPLQLWREGHEGEAIGSALIMAAYFLDNARFTLYRLNEARNFMMDRPTMLRTPVSALNLPTHLLYQGLARPAKGLFNLAWSPESRTSGQSWMSRRLIGADRKIEGLGLAFDRGSESLANAFRIRPSLHHERWQQFAGGLRTGIVDWSWRGVSSLRWVQKYFTWGSEHRVFGYDLRASRRMARQISSLGMQIDILRKTVSFMKSHNITADMIAPSVGSLLTVEYGRRGNLTYKEGNPVIFAQREARLKTLPRTIKIQLPGEKNPLDIAVREIKVVEGSGPRIEVFQGAGGVMHARLIVGSDLLADKAAKIDFTDAIANLNAAVGGIYDGVETYSTGAVHPPEENAAKITPEAEVIRVNEIANRIDGDNGLWKAYKDRKITFDDLDKAVKPERILLKSPNFRGEDLVEQRKIMDNTTVTVGGREMTYLEARALWVRALILKTSGGKITLATPQLKAILAQHDGFSAEIFTGEGKTIIRCALDLLDHPLGRQRIALTHNYLTAQANYNETRKYYEAAGMKVKFVRYTDSGLPETFRGNDAIYLAMDDLAFIDLNNHTSTDSAKVVDIPYEKGVFTIDEFDEIFVSRGQNPYSMSGGDESKSQKAIRAEEKAWQYARKTIVQNKNRPFYEPTADGYKINENAGKIFINEAGKKVSWNELSIAQQRKIIRSLQAENDYHEGQEYAIDYVARDIVIIENGQIAYGSNFNDGIQQALQAKHEGLAVGTRITPESMTIAQILAIRLVNKIQNKVCTSGTLTPIQYVLDRVGIQFIGVETNVPRYQWDADKSYDENVKAIKKAIEKCENDVRIGGRDLQIRGDSANQADILKAVEWFRSIAKSEIPIDQFDKVKGLFIDPNSENLVFKPNISEENIEKIDIPVELKAVLQQAHKGIEAFIIHEPVLSAVSEAKIDAIIKQSRIDIQTGNPIVISVDDPVLAKKIHDRLLVDPTLRAKVKSSGRVGFLAYGNEGSYQAIFDRPIEENFDILITTLARRATDVKTRMPKIFGYLVDQEEGSWGEQQKVGRFGRQGTSAEIRTFTSPDCAIYGSTLGAENLAFITSELAGKSNLTGITEKSTFRDVLELLYRNKVDQKIINDLLTKKVQVGDKKIDLLDRAQAAYDTVLIKRWEQGVKTENLLPADVRHDMEEMRKIYGEKGGHQTTFNKCQNIVQGEIKFLLRREGMFKESINFDVKVAEGEGYRTKMGKVIMNLEKMFGVKIQIEIPDKGEYSMEDFAEKLANQISKHLFDYSKIENRNLRNIIMSEYLKLEMRMFQAQEELIRKYESEGKLIASSDDVSVRERFVAEYKERVVNLQEAFRRRVVAAVTEERVTEAVPISGKYGFIRNLRDSRIKVNSGEVFVAVSDSAAKPTAQLTKLSSTQDNALNYGRAIILTNNGKSRILLQRENGLRVVYDFGNLEVSGSNGKINIGDREFTLEEFKIEFRFYNLTEANPTYGIRFGNTEVRASSYKQNGIGLYEAIVTQLNGGFGFVPKPSVKTDASDVLRVDSSFTTDDASIVEWGLPKVEPVKLPVVVTHNGVYLSRPNTSSFDPGSYGVRPVTINISNLGVRPVDLGKQVNAKDAIPEHARKSNNVAFVEFDNADQMNADAMKKYISSPEFAKELASVRGRKLVIFSRIFVAGMGEPAIKATVISVPDGATVQKVKPEGGREFFSIVDAKSRVPIAFVGINNGQPEFDGTWKPMAVLAKIYGIETAERIAKQRIEFVKARYQGLFTEANGLKDAELKESVIDAIAHASDADLQKMELNGGIKPLVESIREQKVQLDAERNRRLSAEAKEVKLPFEKMNELGSRLADLDDNTFVRVASEENLTFNLPRNIISDIVRADDIISLKLRQAGVRDERTLNDLTLIIRGLPEAERRSFSFETPSGRKGIVSFTNNGVVISLEGIEGSEALEIRLTNTEYNAVVRGRKAYKAAVDEAVEKYKGKKGYERPAIARALSNADHFREAQSTGKPVVIPLIEAEGTRREIELKTGIRQAMQLDLEGGKRAPFDILTSDVEALSSAWKQGGDYKKSEAYVKARASIEAWLKKAGIADRIDLVVDQIEHDSKVAEIGIKANGYFAEAAELAAVKYLNSRLQEISNRRRSGRMTAKQGLREYGKALARSKNIALMLMKNASDALVKYAMGHDLSKLTEQQVRNIFEKLSADAGIAVGAVTEAELGDPASAKMLRGAGFVDERGMITAEFTGDRAAFDAKLAGMPVEARNKAFSTLERARRAVESVDEQVDSITRNFNLSPEGKGVKAWLDYLAMNAPGAGIKVKLASIGSNTIKMAGIGLLAEGLVSGTRVIYRWARGAKGAELKISDELEKVGESGKGWARFEIMSRSSQIFAGMQPGEATAAVIGLQTLWSLTKTPPGQRGMVLAEGTVSLGGFLGFSKIVEKVLKLSGRGGGFASELAGAAAGVIGATSMGSAFNWAAGVDPDTQKLRFPMFHRIFGGPELNAVADAVEFVSPALNKLWFSRVTSGLLLKVGAKTAATLVRRVTPPLLLLDVIMIPGDADVSGFGPAHAVRNPEAGRKAQTADLVSFAQDGKVFFFPNWSHIAGQAKMYKVIDDSYEFSPEDHVMFEMAVMFRHMRHLNASGELNEVMSILDKAFAAYVSGNSTVYHEAFREYAEYFESNSSKKEPFAQAVRSARQFFVRTAKANGYGYTEVNFSADARAKLEENYIKFLAAKEQKRFNDFIAKVREEIRTNVNKEKGAVGALKAILGQRAKFETNLRKEIKARFELGDSEADAKTASGILSVVLSGSISVEAATLQICRMRGIDPSSEKGAGVRRFVEVAKGRSANLNHVTSLQIGAFREELKAMGYVDYIDGLISSGKIKKEDKESYLTGRNFEQAFVDFLTDREQKKYSPENVNKILDDANNADDDDFTKMIKSEFRKQRAEYEKAYPGYFTIPGNELEFRKNFISAMCWQWTDHSAEVKEESRKQFEEMRKNGGKLSIHMLNREDQDDFVNYLSNLPVNEGGIVLGSADAHGLTPEMAIYLISLSKDTPTVNNAPAAGQPAYNPNGGPDERMDGRGLGNGTM